MKSLIVVFFLSLSSIANASDIYVEYTPDNSRYGMGLRLASFDISNQRRCPSPSTRFIKKLLEEDLERACDGYYNSLVKIKIVNVNKSQVLKDWYGDLDYCTYEVAYKCKF